ncbi:alpha/beta hydrolase family protein [Ponticaulis profundi]|uniref:Alpha/beta hydrolase family protein n=1 Tax=Ponticaulis profundi TaxID=2665222 RepID=A0ABW1S5M5_9PROT
MRQYLPIAKVATAAFAILGIGSAAAEPLSIEDFRKYPLISSPSLSPEGDMMVAVITEPGTDGEQRAAAYWDLSGNISTDGLLAPDYITPTSGKSKFYSASALKQKKSFWYTVQPYTGALMGCGEGKTTGSTKKYIQKVYMGNENIKKIDDLPSGRTELGADKMQQRCFELEGDTSVATTLPLDPTDIVIARASTKDGTTYYRHNLKTGKEKFLYKASDVESVQLDPKTAEPYATNRLEYVDGEWRQFYGLLDPTKGEVTEEAPLTMMIKERYEQRVLGPQQGTNNYFIATDRFSDKVAVYLYDVTTDTFSDEPVLAHPDFNVGSIIFSRRAEDWGQPLGFTYQAEISKTYWLDAEMSSIQKGLEAAYPGQSINLMDYTDDRNRILFSVSSSTMPPAYFLLLDKQKVAAIGSSRPWIDTDSLGETKLVYYTARDGLEIPALLTLPPGYEEGQKVRGAIIHPHGGPWARDSAYFDGFGWIQYFASRGYAVLQPQYRGSDGWGRELWLAGDKQWGLAMQDDKDDGAAWLVDQGIVDADKIAIHGYSYGGFAAIAASVRPNSPYQCAIAGAGVSNLAKLGNEWGDNRIQRIVQGDTVTGMDPMQNTDKVNIPILLYHGDYDVRVPLFHSRDFYNAIKSRSPQSELIVYKQMGHQSAKWLPEHTADILEQMERFLTTTCGM